MHRGAKCPVAKATRVCFLPIAKFRTCSRQKLDVSTASSHAATRRDCGRLPGEDSTHSLPFVLDTLDLNYPQSMALQWLLLTDMIRVPGLQLISCGEIGIDTGIWNSQATSLQLATVEKSLHRHAPTM